MERASLASTLSGAASIVPVPEEEQPADVDKDTAAVLAEITAHVDSADAAGVCKELPAQEQQVVAESSKAARLRAATEASGADQPESCSQELSPPGTAALRESAMPLDLASEVPPVRAAPKKEVKWMSDVATEEGSAPQQQSAPVEVPASKPNRIAPDLLKKVELEPEVHTPAPNESQACSSSVSQSLYSKQGSTVSQADAEAEFRAASLRLQQEQRDSPAWSRAVAMHQQMADVVQEEWQMAVERQLLELGEFSLPWIFLTLMMMIKAARLFFKHVAWVEYRR